MNKPNVFSIRPKGQSLPARAVRGFAPLIEHALGLDLWNQRYVHCGQADTPREFIRRVFESFRVHWRIRESDIARIPRTGPLIVVANHPFGAMEGLFLADLLLRIRPDSKLLVNYLLSRVPNLRDVFFFVDPFGGPSAAKANLAGTKQAIRHVKDGGLLGVFPAGEVSSFNLRTMTVTDKPWSPSIGRIIQATGAPVLPVFFEGQNSVFFHAAGLVHPRLRTLLLAREMIGKSGQKLGVRVGSVIPHRRLKEFEDADTLIDFLRQRTYLLQHRPAPQPRRRRRRRRLRRIPLSIRRRRVLTKVPEAIIPPVAIESIRAEVDALPPDQWLSQNDDFAVVHADASQIPSLLREIGRLREITFRATGEGTGKSIDLDRFDEYYVHLFVWDRKERQLVGAYRMGESDKILPTMGMGGLYTATLFLYDAKLLRKISPALELGRSFVKEEYQKSYGPLLMLWRGIAAYATKYPKYRYVFGPVSISNTYQTVSKSLMVEFLKNHHSPQQLSELVMARNPFRPSRLRGLDLRHGYATFETDDLSDLVADIEPDQKGIPVLLRQYLKLGAKLLAFNVDPDFGDCVDGLIVVDLAANNVSLDRYFDKATRRQYQARHGVFVESRSAG